MPQLLDRASDPVLLDYTERYLEEIDGAKITIDVELEFNFPTSGIGGATPNAARWIAAVNTLFGPQVHSVVSVRYIAGTTTWSQHAYGNAVDTMVSYPGKLHHDIAFFADANRGAFSVAHLLADPYFPSPRRDHLNHVHVDFYPQGTGDPRG
jgi:hypothetical protein